MNKLFISLFGALALLASASGQASTTNDIYNRLDNDQNYQNLSSEDQDIFDNALENSLNNLQEKGINLTDSNSQMFLIDSITKFLGLSGGKEAAAAGKKMAAPAMGDAVVAPEAGNSLSPELRLVESNGQYFLLDTIGNIVGKVKDVVGGILGGGSKPAPAPAPGTVFNSLDGSLDLNEANAHYGATLDAIKAAAEAAANAAKALVAKGAQLIASGADKVADRLSKKPAEVEVGADENSLGSDLMLVDANAQYGETWDAIKAAAKAAADAAKAVIGKGAELIASGAGKIADMAKPKPATTTVTVETAAE